VTISRTPFFFGPEDRSLFGWYSAPAETAEAVGDVAMVICPPLGHEYMSAHRSVRHLADALARAGISNVRFDYHGTGDSQGDDRDPDRVAAWSASVHEAMAAVRNLSGCPRVGLIGIRLGATIAVSAAADVDVPLLALWAPCVRGKSYAREMKALHLTGANRERSADSHIEPGGFVVTEQTQRDISCLNLEAVCPRVGRALIVMRDDLAPDTRLRDTWRASGIVVEQEAMSGYADMFEAPHATLVPHQTIDAIVGWVARNACPRADVAQTVSSTTATTPIVMRYSQVEASPDSAVSLREAIVRIDAENEIFGILSEPAAGVNPSVPTILLPNAGSTHHVGPNRLYVVLARELSRAGFRCFRFDLAGLGDSVIDDCASENDPYPPGASATVAHAIDALRARDAAGSVVLMGLCSGAHTSFHAALDLDNAAVAECVLINPLAFYYQRGTPLDPTTTNHYHEWQRYMRSMRSLEGWSKLFRDDVHVTEIVRNVFNRFRDIVRNRIAAFNQGADDGASRALDSLEADLRRIAGSGRRLTFVFSRFDPGYDLLMINAPRAVKRLKHDGHLALWRIDDASHTFEASESRGVMLSSLRDHLTARYLR
jgi:alpha-beta hydrolase superfamily lysophospholipase